MRQDFSTSNPYRIQSRTFDNEAMSAMSGTALTPFKLDIIPPPSWPLNGFSSEVSHSLMTLKAVSRDCHMNIVPGLSMNDLKSERSKNARELSLKLADAFHKTVQFHRHCHASRSSEIEERPTTMAELSKRIDELGSGLDEGLEARTLRLRSAASKLSEAIWEDGSQMTTPGKGVWECMLEGPTPTLVGFLRSVDIDDEDQPTVNLLHSTLSGVKATSETFIMRYKTLCAKGLSQDDILPVPPSILELHGLHWGDGKLLNSDGSVAVVGWPSPTLKAQTQEKGENLGGAEETTDTEEGHAMDSDGASVS